jgi:nicotinate phosphoribosyltransferase
VIISKENNFMELEIELKKSGKISRLTNKTFQFSPRLGEGFFTANYFIKTNLIVSKFRPNHVVTLQFFQRNPDMMVCGLDESIALIHTFAKSPETLTIEALNDGDMIGINEPVLKITGKYEYFGFLESMIDGILSRRTSVATSVKDVLKAANNKPVFSMADRQDDYHSQVGDGYATFVAGISKVSTDAQGAWWGGRGMGTMPHALIQVCNGDIKLACDLYVKTFPEEQITALIDYNNDVVNDSVNLAKHLKEKLKAVRVDTSMSLIDKYFIGKDTSKFDPHGVCKELIFGLRNALDAAGFPKVKIVVSSGFTPEKIKSFEDAHAPVDMYGVGLYLVRLTTNFTGDLVMLDGLHQAKVGRGNIISKRLQIVPFPIYK